MLFGLEKTVSYGKRKKNGSKREVLRIIKASHQVELFDEELNKEFFTKKLGIKTLKPNGIFKIKSKLNDALDQLSEINEKILLKKKKHFSFRR